MGARAGSSCLTVLQYGDAASGASPFFASPVGVALKPLPGTGSAMRAARPATRAAFPHLELLDQALDSAAARRSLFGRDDPTNPFVSRQRRQIFPSRPRLRFRAERHAQVRRSFVNGTGLTRFALAHRLIVTLPGTSLNEQSGSTAFGVEAVTGGRGEIEFPRQVGREAVSRQP